MLTSEHGHFLLILACFLAILQALFGLVGAGKGWRNWMNLVPTLAHLQFLAVLGSFLILMRAFVMSDFSLSLVANNSNTAKPLIYKISGTWGNHEGSMLMWVTVLALFGAAIALTSRNMPIVMRSRVLGVQALIGVAFFAFIILTSNPFIRLASPPENGFGLNPLLQDPGLAFHPPALYLGYVGLSVAFSFAIAGLLDGRVDAAWARFVRPWTLATWIFLTIGIALGSWWAYYELGWGGYWFWDPVENVSFMPWLISVALLHSAIVVEKRDTLKSWTILLAIIGFSFSLIGTFVVRSGVLTSVHSFASNPERGMFILIIIVLTMAIGFGLYAWRAPKLVPSGAFAPLSRESGIVMNNLLLCVATAVVFVGTMWPLFAEVVTGKKLSVGEPFFNISFTPFMILLALLLPIGSSIPWKRARMRHVKPVLMIIGAIALTLSLLTFLRQGNWSLMAPIAVLLSAWVIFGALFDIHNRARQGENYLARLRTIPRSDWGKMFGHIGFGIVILSIGIIQAYEFEDIRSQTPGQTYEAAGFEVNFERVEQGRGPNYIYARGVFELTKGGKTYVLTPELRQFPVESSMTTEAAIMPYWLGDLYLVIAQGQKENQWSVYFYIKPLINLLWIGALVMALGGLLSLLDRRMRIGVVK